MMIVSRGRDAGPDDGLLHYSIDTFARVVTVTYAGDPSAKAWSSLMERVFSDPDWQPGFGILLDRRFVKDAATISYVMSAMSFFEQHREVIGRGRVAVVFEDGSQAFGMGRMGEAMAAQMDFPLRAFLNMRDALSWVRTGRG